VIEDLENVPARLKLLESGVEMCMGHENPMGMGTQISQKWEWEEYT